MRTLPSLACVSLIALLSACGEPSDGYYDADGRYIDTSANSEPGVHNVTLRDREKRANRTHYSRRGYYDYNGNYIDSDEDNLNMVTSGGQASIPLAWAIASVNKDIDYIETISSIASRSAGPATRINLDEYLITTEFGIKSFSNSKRSKAILNLNPAQPCVDMQTTVFAKIENPDLARTTVAIHEMVKKLQTYIPGYQLIVEPMIENERLVVMVRVRGLGDYLPSYAGNLDIINCAAVATAESFAKKNNRK